MAQKPRETLYVLNRSDLDRMHAAVDLLGQVIEELTEARAFPVPKEPQTSGALYELADAAEFANDERRAHNDAI